MNFLVRASVHGNAVSARQTAVRACFSRWNSTTATAAGPPHQHTLYDHHRPTSALQKIMLSIGSSLTVLSDPQRADMLAVLGEVTGRDALKKLHRKMLEDEVGKRILKEKPLIRSGSVELEPLLQYEEGTFGKAYATFMSTNGFHPDGRAHVQFVDDAELAYVMQRFRELHDFWHVLFDLPPTEYGEIILKFVELTQTGLPVCALSGFVGPLRLTRAQNAMLFNTYIPWAYRVGNNCSNLLNVYYEDEFSTPLEELRTRLGVELAPKYHE